MKMAQFSLLALSAVLSSAPAVASETSLELVPGLIRTCATAREARESFGPALQLSRPAYRVRGSELEISIQLQYLLCVATGESTATWSPVLPENTYSYELPDGTRGTVRSEQNRLTALPWSGKLVILDEVEIANVATQRVTLRAKLSGLLTSEQVAAYDSGKPVSVAVDLFGKSLVRMSAPNWSSDEYRESFTGSYVLRLQLKK